MASSPTALSPSMQLASLYVGDLHPDVSEGALYEAFSDAGNVASCRVCRDSVTRKSLGYGYVNYYSVQDAERALETLNYTTIKGRSVRVNWSQRDSALRKNTNSNIFVKNLDESIDNKALHDTFSIFGNITSCKVQTNSNGTSKGYGFVCYESEDSAKQAIERVNGMKIGDNKVFVGPFLKREELEAGSSDEFTNLYVKHMPEAWDEDAVAKVFGEFGEVASLVIMTSDEGKRFSLINFKESSSAKAAVEKLHRNDMRTEAQIADAKAEAEAKAKAESTPAKEKADGPEGEDRKAEAKEEKAEEHPEYLLYVQRAQTRAERKAMLEEERKKKKGAGKGKAGVRLCVRNLNEDMTEEELRNIFEPHGTVLHTIVRTDKDGGKCTGLGFVILATVDEATKAVAETHTKMVNGKPLNVGLSERRRAGEGGEDTQDGGAAADRRGGAKGGGKDEGKGRRGRGKGKGGAGPPSGPMPPPMGSVLPPYPYSVQPLPPLGKGGAALGAPMPPYGVPPQVRPGTYSLPPAVAAGTGQPMPMAGYPPGWPTMPTMPTMQRPPMPGMLGMPQGMPMMVPATPQAAAPLPLPVLTREALAAMPPQAQKQQLGERLFAQIHRYRPDLAGKITGMILELDNDEILVLLISADKLHQKIMDAVSALGARK